MLPTMGFCSEGNAYFLRLRVTIVSRCETTESTSPENSMAYKFSTVFAAFPCNFLACLNQIFEINVYWRGTRYLSMRL